MSHPSLLQGVSLLLAVLLSLLLTRLMIGLAHHRNWVVKPKADRWSQTPTALYGGVAMFSAFLLGISWLFSTLANSHRYDLFGLIIGGIVIFGVGLRDDVQALNPLVKLLGEVMAVTPFLVGVGLTWTSPAFVLSIPLTLFWMVALTNAFNLLDNMDGLSAGTASIVALMLGGMALLHHSSLNALLCGLMAAACLGFLAYNFRIKGPARIFMGDCGSLFLGYMLGGLAITEINPLAPDKITMFALPLLIMALPIFDTTLVIILRKREGRAISQGGKDHSSHRLVYAGCNEKQAVLLLYGISFLAGGLALALERLHQPLFAVFAVSLLALALAGLGRFLSRYSGMHHAAVSAVRVEASSSVR